MTEADWLASNDPTPMLDYLRGRATDRKLRLIVCGCCCRIWSLLKDVRSRQGVEVSERFADGLAKREELHRANRNAAVVRRSASPAFNGTEMNPIYALGSAVVNATCKNSDLRWAVSSVAYETRVGANAYGRSGG
jgi:hypothetical protein